MFSLILFIGNESYCQGIKGISKQYTDNDVPGRVHKIVNFMTPGVGVFSAEVWPYKLYSENTLFLLRSSSLLPCTDQAN